MFKIYCTWQRRRFPRCRTLLCAPTKLSRSHYFQSEQFVHMPYVDPGVAPYVAFLAGSHNFYSPSSRKACPYCHMWIHVWLHMWLHFLETLLQKPKSGATRIAKNMWHNIWAAICWSHSVAPHVAPHMWFHIWQNLWLRKKFWSHMFCHM